MAGHEFGFDGQLMAGIGESFTGKFFGNPFHFKQYAPRAHDGDPEFGVALTAAHSSFRGFLCNGFVREDVDPEFSPAFDFSHNRHTGGFDLLIGDPAALEGFQSEFAKAELAAAVGFTLHPALSHFAMFYSLWDEHGLLPLSFRRNEGAFILGENFAQEDPDLDTDSAILGMSRGMGEIYVGPQGVQGHAPLAEPFCAGHFGAAETPVAIDPDTQGAGLHGSLDRLFHGAAEADAAKELRGNIFPNKLGHEVGFADFVDVDEYPFSRCRFELLAKGFDLGAFSSNDDARASGMDGDLRSVGSAVNLHLGNTGMEELLFDFLADFQVLMKKIGVILFGIPSGIPIPDDAEP